MVEARFGAGLRSCIGASFFLGVGVGAVLELGTSTSTRLGAGRARETRFRVYCSES